MSLSFSKSNSPWGLTSATETGLNLNFSASFDLKSVKKIEQKIRLKKYERLAVWALLILGGICLGLQTYFNLPAQNWAFLFGHELLNMPIVLGLLAALYMWAQNREEEIKQDSLNLFFLNTDWHNTTNHRSAIKEADVFMLFNNWAQVAWQAAIKSSLQKNLPYLSLNELLIALLDCSDTKEALFRLGMNSSDLQNFLRKNPCAEIDEEILKLPFLSFEMSGKLHNKTIDPLMLFCSSVKMCGDNSPLAKLFVKLDISQKKLETVSAWIFNLRILRNEIKLFKKLSKLKPTGNMNVGLTAVPTPHLDRFSTDLTWQARAGRLPLTLGRHSDFEEIFQLFAQNSRQILIKGEVGTGRSTLINELAFKMASEQVPKTLQDKRLLKIEISGIVGSSGKSENALEQILNEADRSGNIVLAIEDIEQLAKAKASSGLNLLEILVDYLQNSSLQVIITCDLSAYVDFLQNTPNFSQVFAEYELKELTQEQIILAACIKASILENKHNCLFLFQSIERAVELSNELIHGLGQPQKTISLLSETATKNKSSGSQAKLITPAEIENTISQKTHVPKNAVSGQEAEKLLNLEKVLAKSVVGQTQAVKAVCQALRRAKSGLASGSRPLASFLFLGPTGVGKTEVAKALAREYFGKEEFLLRLDMSEFSSNDAMYKLLGQKGESFDPPLIKHLKNYPFCLLLLDEFEKARSEVHNLFLQVLDDGRLTTAKGELIDMKHTLIIATSNAGTKQIQEGFKAGLSSEKIKEQLFESVLLKTFPPELLNRFDATIVFSPLTPQDITEVVRLQLKFLQKQLEEKGISLEFGQSVVEDIATNAFDPQMGGRPVRRYIQDHTENFIAELLLSKKINRGFKGTVDIKDDKLIIT